MTHSGGSAGGARARSYATRLLGYADPDDVRLRFDVLTKTKQPELLRYWTTRDRAVNVRLFRLAAEVLAAIEAGVFPRTRGGSARSARSGVIAGDGDEKASGGGAVWTPAGAMVLRRGGERDDAGYSESKSRKVNGYVKAVLALAAVRRKRDARYDRFVRPIDRKRDQLAAQPRRV